MEITIREISESDYNAVLSLWNNELGNHTVTAENIAPHHERVKNDDRYKTFVAVVDGNVVGFVTSVWSHAVGCEVGFMQITGIATDSKLQGKGIGAKLIEAMENHAKTKGIDSMLLGCGVKRIGAHAFYERQGYDKGSWMFAKSL